MLTVTQTLVNSNSKFSELISMILSLVFNTLVASLHWWYHYSIKNTYKFLAIDRPKKKTFLSHYDKFAFLSISIPRSPCTKCILQFLLIQKSDFGHFVVVVIVAFVNVANFKKDFFLLLRVDDTWKWWNAVTEIDLICLIERYGVTFSKCLTIPLYWNADTFKHINQCI